MNFYCVILFQYAILFVSISVCVRVLKSKSLSKEMQAKLLQGTPLQRELGRVLRRLEEVENERNAYRDAMVLACDTFLPEESLSESNWIDDVIDSVKF